MSKNNKYANDCCNAAEQATKERPCWGDLSTFDEIILEDGDDWGFWACEGHFDGMFIGGDPCDMEKYKKCP